MSDEEALLAAIRADPDEDTPRLAYADWLDEHATRDAGRARAEFIRVQIALDRLPDWGDFAEEERRERLQARQKELLDAHRPAWQRPPGAAKPGFPADGIGFRRGFPEDGFFRTDQLRDFADEIYSYPLLRSLSVSALDVFTLDYLLELPWLEEVRGLELVVHQDPQFGLPDWSALAACHRFHSLRAIEFGYAVPLTPTVAGRLAGNGSLAGVRDLRCWEEPGRDALGPLLSGPAFADLSLLQVYNLAVIGAPRPLPPLGGNPRCAGLERLRLNGYAVAPPELAGLVAGDFWPNLRELRLGGGTVAPGSLRVLGQADGRVENVSLPGNGLKTLAGLGGPLLETVRSLQLSSNRDLPSAALAELADGPAALRHLDLSDCYAIDDAGAELIAGSPAFAGLCQLDLINTAVGPDGARALAESPHLSDRLTLLLHGCPLEADGEAAVRARFGDRAHW